MARRERDLDWGVELGLALTAVFDRVLVAWDMTPLAKELGIARRTLQRWLDGSTNPFSKHSPLKPGDHPLERLGIMRGLEYRTVDEWKAAVLSEAAATPAHFVFERGLAAPSELAAVAYDTASERTWDQLEARVVELLQTGREIRYLADPWWQSSRIPWETHLEKIIARGAFHSIAALIPTSEPPAQHAFDDLRRRCLSAGYWGRAERIRLVTLASRGAAEWLSLGLMVRVDSHLLIRDTEHPLVVFEFCWQPGHPHADDIGAIFAFSDAYFAGLCAAAEAYRHPPVPSAVPSAIPPAVPPVIDGNMPVVPAASIAGVRRTPATASAPSGAPSRPTVPPGFGPSDGPSHRVERVEFDPEWRVPMGSDDKLGPLDRISCGDTVDTGRTTQLDADWLPFRPRTRTPYSVEGRPEWFPTIEGFSLLGLTEFSCDNDIEGEKRFVGAVYRCEAFVTALLQAGFLTDRPTMIHGTDPTADADAADALPQWGGVSAVDTEFVLLPPVFHDGRFVMGSPEDEPKRSPLEGPPQRIHITTPFLIARTAVTQRVWQAVMGRRDGDFATSGDAAMLPVETAAWKDIAGPDGFLARIEHQLGAPGFGLPSEAQWEFACRAGTQTPFCFGSGRTVTSRLINFDGNYPYHGAEVSPANQQRVPVGSLPMNAFGLFEMHGNVFEWCADEWENSLDGIPPDGTPRPTTAASLYRVYRGGSWVSNAMSCRSAIRNRAALNDRFIRIGFRPIQLVLNPTIGSARHHPRTAD